MQIGKITFTDREIDIISCILNSRGAKKIASILFISPRTVETHIQNILMKIGGNSQETIIDFIEQSKQFKVIKEHYLNLLITAIFEQQLKQIAHLIKKYRLFCAIICSDEESKDPSLQLMIKHLKIVGLGIIITKDNLFTQNLENSNNYRNIYLLSQKNIDSLLLNGSFQIKKSDILLIKDSATQILISKKPLGVQIGKNIINLSTKDQYFQNVFYILKELIIEIDIEPFINEFQKIKESIIDSKGENISESLLNNQKNEEIEQGNKTSSSTLTINKKRTTIFFVFILISLALLILLITIRLWIFKCVNSKIGT